MSAIGFGDFSPVSSVGVSVHDKRAKQGSESVPKFYFLTNDKYFFK